jgi:hypothetical protein
MPEGSAPPMRPRMGSRAERDSRRAMTKYVKGSARVSPCGWNTPPEGYAAFRLLIIDGGRFLNGEAADVRLAAGFAGRPCQPTKKRVMQDRLPDAQNGSGAYRGNPERTPPSAEFLVLYFLCLLRREARKGRGYASPARAFERSHGFSRIKRTANSNTTMIPASVPPGKKIMTIIPADAVDHHPQ